MIVNERLGAWLSDKRRQAETLSDIDASGCRYRAADAVRSLEADLAAADANSAAAILAAAARFADRTAEIEAELRAMMRSALANPFYRPPLKLVSTAVHIGLLLADTPQLSVLLAVTTPDALAAKRTWRQGGASITFGGQQTFFKFLKAGGATLSLWEAPEIAGGFTASDSGRCRRVERRPIVDGETIRLDGSREAFVIDHCESDIVYLQAATPVGAAPLSVEYDSETHAFAGASSTLDQSSRVQMMVSLLRMLDRADAVPLFREAIATGPFFVRWHIMREFLALDAELALPTLHDMARSDTHPEVRAAALVTLEQFFPPAGAPPRQEGPLCPA